MERQCGNIVSLTSAMLGLFCILLCVRKSNSFKTVEMLPLTHDVESKYTRTENKVWAVLPVPNHGFTEPKHTTDPVPVTRKRRSKFPRDSGRFRPYNHRLFHQRTGAASKTGYKSVISGSAFSLNGANFPARNIGSPIYCPPGCVCFSKDVECKYANWKQIPHGIPIHTEKLLITGNILSTLNASTFEGLVNLKSLILTNNQIRAVHEETFANLPRLRRLRLNQNQLSNLPEDVFRGLTQLQRLDLRENKLACLPPNIFKGLLELRYINLSGNNIYWISGDSFSDQSHLKQLDLTGNPFKCDCHIRPLIAFFLSTNQLPLLARSGATCHTHEGEVGQSSQTIGLHLLHQNNCPEGDLPKTHVACAEQAPASSSCLSVCDCTVDRAANCQRRGLKSIPQDLPPDLMEINLAHNELESLPEMAFKNYPKLRKIVLDNNQITHVDGSAFNGLHELSSLYMSSNKLQALSPGLFLGLNNLKILYLHRNKISCLQQGSFEGLENLQILHLSENRIQTFPRGSFTDLRRLKYLYLVHNPLICDCRMAWLPAFLVEKEAGGTQWARCAEPLEVQGRHVRDLLPTLMSCDDSLINSHSAEGEESCDILKLKCPEKCRCTEITVTPKIQASSDVPFQLDELGLISDGLSVDCSEAGLTELPENMPVNTKDLNLRNNRIRELKADSILTELPQLNTLMLDGNRIEKIDSLAFRANRELKKLILSNNSLGSFDHRILQGMTKLQVLLLQHNELTCLNNMTFGTTSALRILMLNNNKIRCITKGSFDTMRLDSLSLSANPLNCDCHLSWLPDWLRDHVNQVIAGPLPPTCVEPEQLAGTPVASLARYHFTCNNTPGSGCHSGLGSGPPGSSPCSDSTASCCNEEQAPVPQFGCPVGCNCEADGVYCSDLGLAEIPAGIPPGTTQLYLGRNQIKTLDPSRIGHLKKLHTLVLSYNKLRELPENVFESLKNLKTLVLSHNEIQCIHPNAFNGLSGLRVLILQANNISSIPYGTFNGLLQLNNIALGQNPLHCDCNGKWLNSFFRQQFLDNGIALCHSPENMRFKSLYHSKPGDFVCPWIRRTGQNQSSPTEDMATALFVDEVASESGTSPHEPRGWGTVRSVSSDDVARMSPEERASLAVASKCLPCMLNPCTNGGQCAARGQLDFQCNCPTPYHGRRCELEQNACSRNPCKNGGLCEVISLPSEYRCICSKGFQGERCEESIKVCSNHYCDNGGICEVVNNEQRCHCAAGFHGPRCQYAFVYCKDLNPCLNGGKCIALPENKYRCECTKGWTGKNCQTNADDCLYNRCENGASCVDGINEYICKCRPGYVGIYCERPTWNPDSYVTRMDRRIPARHLLKGFSSSEVRHSPIKIRSLSTPPLETLCAYHQCQNKATCVESHGDVYQCVCNPGFSGQYCEHLFSISLPSTHSYIAIVPPSRGALVPRGTVSLKVSTRSSSGILVYYADLIKTGKNELPEQYLLVDLEEGHVRVMFALAKDLNVERRSVFKINDGHAHTIQIRVESDNLTLTVDKVELPNNSYEPKKSAYPLPNEPESRTRENVTVLRHLALTNPLYFGGAPADRLEAAGRILNKDPVLGMTGCIEEVQINERPIDLARLFGAPVDKMTGAQESHSERPSAEAKQHGTAIGILPGCYTKPKMSQTAVSGSRTTELVGGEQWNSASDPTERSESTNCANPKVCLNGGTCVRLSTDTTHYKCECADGFTGPHCEKEQSCHRSTQRSFIRDPQTSCISTRKLTVRTCGGSCSGTGSDEDSTSEGLNDLTYTEQADATRSLWLPESIRRHRRSEKEDKICCQPIKVRYRRVHFQCVDGSAYERTVKLIKRCGCIHCV